MDKNNLPANGTRFFPDRFRKLICARIICFTIFFFITGPESKAQYVNIPDTNFQAWLTANGFAGCMSGSMLDTTCSVVVSVMYVNCDSGNISDLTGIQYFDNLYHLECRYNNLTFLPPLPATLNGLFVSHNQLTALQDLPDNLQTLNCDYNSIVSLPSTLPTQLIDLQCEHNQLTSLPPLPAFLSDLICTDNQLSYLPALPSGLLYLRCSSNQLTSLPALPSSLQELFCANNQLTSLPSLPSSLTGFLICEVNNLTSLPPLPPSINYLWCGENQLTSLPALPLSLFSLRCNQNLLTTLPSLPDTLDELWCSENQLTELPELPDTLSFLYIGNNNISCLPELKVIWIFDWPNTNITCLPNAGVITISSPAISTLPLCQPSDSCAIYRNISGEVFNDVNGNCIRDIGDIPLSNIPVALDSSGIQIQSFLTDRNGEYFFRADTGTYIVRVDTLHEPFQIVCPFSFTHTSNITAFNFHDSLADFSLQCKPGFDLIAGSISPNTWFRPGAQRTLFLTAGFISTLYGVACEDSIGGSVQLSLSTLLTYVSPAPGALVPSSVSGGIVTWNVSDFSMIDPVHDFNIFVQVAPSATTSDSICNTLNVLPASDNNSSNNSVTSCFPVRNSFDPNEKYMVPSGFVSSTEEWFSFTVYFQNTGNAPAEDIYILDTLDPNFDAATFTFLSSSHQAVTQLLPGNVLRFNFPDINLIDSVADEPGSHGYVQFKVRRKDGLPFNTTLTNTAYIYFDFNPAVVTNQTSATLILIIGMDEAATPSFEIYPNPGRGEFAIYCPQLTVGKEMILKVYDVLGKEIKIQQIQTPGTKFQTTNWPAGVYFVELCYDGRKEVKKLIIQ